LAGCNAVDARVQTQSVTVHGDTVELAVAERLPQDGQRAFLIHAMNRGPFEERTPVEWGASRRIAEESEAAQRCPMGWDRTDHTEIFTESLTWIRCQAPQAS
jgi:hypothetical protein